MTPCLLLLLLTAEFDLLEPVVACIFVYYLYLPISYVHRGVGLLEQDSAAYPTVLGEPGEALGTALGTA